jgi:hypothetical protein
MWYDIKGYEGLYKINKKGQVLSLSRELWNGKVFHLSKERILSSVIANCNGVKYFVINLRKDNKNKRKYIHRLLAETFIENPLNLKVVNHIDNDSTNNDLSNLEWVSHDYNISHGWSFKEKKSKYPGLSINTAGRWRLRITINGKMFGLGTYDTEEEAYSVYLQKRKELGRL